MPAFAAADPSKSGTCICKQANGTVIQNLGTKQTELECSNTCHTTYSAQYPGVLYNYENLSTAQEIAGAVTSSVSGAVSSLGDSIMWVFNALLYTIFNIAGLTVSIGSTMLEFVLDPVAFTGLFNLKAVYDLWKMVRDFFNLFFILIILFIAFATIFQVQAYNYKKLLWQLVLMALLVNFSFPVSRFIIDLANVPMYFFLNSIAPGSATGAGGKLASSFFTAASLKTVLLPSVTGYDSSLKGGADLARQIIQATIFVFIFGISVMSLSILLFIRAITLLALVIFSPIGFIGTAIPWFASLASDWWKKLLSNAFFGPTAALMLLVAVKVMQAFQVDNATRTALDAIAAKNSASLASSVNLASLTVFAVPIIFIWMSITVGKNFGIAGADKVIGSAQKFASKTGRNAAKWGGKATLQVGTLGQANRIGAYAKGTGAALKNVPKSGQLFGKNIGGEKGAAVIRHMGKADERKKDQELKAKSIAEKGLKAGKASAATEIHKRNVAEAEKEFEEKKHDEAKLREYIDPSHPTHAKASEAQREAAARMLVKKDAIRNQADLDSAIAAVKSPEGKADIIRKVDKKVIQQADKLVESVGNLGDDFKSIATLLDKVDGDAMKMDLTQYTALLNRPELKKNAALQAQVKEKLDGRLRKEGRLKPIIDHEIANNLGTRRVEDVYIEHFDKMTASDIGKMKDFHGDKSTPMNANLQRYIENKFHTTGEWSIQDMQEAYKNLKGDQKHAWREVGLNP